jgi:anti-anti-sigma factor
MQSFNQGTLAVEQVAERGRAPCTVLRLGGEHDVATAGAVRDALADARDAAVVVDLTACTFADSSIISTLLQARRERPAFAVVLPSDPASAVVRAFAITDVTAHLACCASLDDARRLIETGQRPPSV